MPKAGELDWTDLMEGKTGQPEHPLSKGWTSPPNKGGEKVTKEDLMKEADFILRGFQVPGIKQPSTNEFEQELVKMFPYLAMTEVEWERLHEEWLSKPNKVFEELKKAKVQEEPDKEWGECKSFNDTLSREEQLARYMFVGD